MKDFFLSCALAAALICPFGCAGVTTPVNPVLVTSAVSDLAQHSANVSEGLKTATTDQLPGWEQWAEYLLDAAEIAAPYILKAIPLAI